MEGLNRGIGTLLGMLFGAYGGGMTEKRRRAELAARQQALGLPPDLPEESSYLERLLNPGAGQQDLAQRRTLLEVLAAEQRKEQDAQQEYEREQGGRRELAGERERAEYRAAEYEKGTPQSKLPQELRNIEAQTLERTAGAGLKRGQEGLIREALRRTQGIKVGDAPGAPGTPGAPGGGGEAEYEYSPLPDINVGGFSFPARKTTAKMAAEEAAKTAAREGATPLPATTAVGIASLEAAGGLVERIKKTVREYPEYLGPEQSIFPGARRGLGAISPQQAVLQKNVDRLNKTILHAFRKAQVGPREEEMFKESLLSLGAARDPEVFFAEVDSMMSWVNDVINASLKYATTPQSRLGESGSKLTTSTPLRSGDTPTDEEITAAIERFKKARRGE